MTYCNRSMHWFPLPAVRGFGESLLGPCCRSARPRTASQGKAVSVRRKCHRALPDYSKILKDFFSRSHYQRRSPISVLINLAERIHSLVRNLKPASARFGCEPKAFEVHQLYCMHTAAGLNRINISQYFRSSCLGAQKPCSWPGFVPWKHPQFPDIRQAEGSTDQQFWPNIGNSQITLRFPRRQRMKEGMKIRM